MFGTGLVVLKCFDVAQGDNAKTLISKPDNEI